MNNRLPVNIENLELPVDQFKKMDNKVPNSYGFASVMYLLSSLITLGTVITLVLLLKGWLYE